MGSNRPPEPHTPEWCAVNPNRCKGDNVPGVPIDSGFFQIIMVVLIMIVVWRAQVRIKKQINEKRN